MDKTDKKELCVSLHGTQMQISNIQFQKMMFLYNAINDGWSVKKQQDSYIFKKNHEGKREIFCESYLHNFIKDQFDVNKLLNKT
jgi:hypothetical protein